MTGPGHDEETDEYGTRCRVCSSVVYDGSQYPGDGIDICRRCAIDERKKEMATCSHKFVDSTRCLKCGWEPS